MMFLWVFSGTIFSWGALGLVYGFGYCFLTDIHWQVKHSLGERLPPSYIHYIFENWFDLALDRNYVDLAVGIVFFLLLFIYLFLMSSVKKRLKN